MRHLKQGFMDALLSGVLKPLLEWCRRDETLCLDIRDNGVTLYYRGAGLVNVEAHGGAFRASTNGKYKELFGGAFGKIQFQETVATAADCDVLVAQIPLLKGGVDGNRVESGKNPREREIQQEIIRVNNLGPVGRSSDVYFCDQEYAVRIVKSSGEDATIRPDLVGVLWPSIGAVRKRVSGHRLIWAEVKVGDGALAGKAGIQDHLDDLDRLFQDDQKMAKIKQEMAGVFRQKCELGLMDVGKWHDAQEDGDFFSDEKPLVLLFLVDHDPAKSKLASELSAATDMQKGELSISRASNMGYALYQECLLSKQDWLDFDEKTRGGNSD